MSKTQKYEASYELNEQPCDERHFVKLNSRSKLPLTQLFKYSALIQDCFNDYFVSSILQKIEQFSEEENIKKESIEDFFHLLDDKEVKINKNNYEDLYKLSKLFQIEALDQVLQKYQCKFRNALSYQDIIDGNDHIQNKNKDFLIPRLESPNQGLDEITQIGLEFAKKYSSFLSQISEQEGNEIESKQISIFTKTLDLIISENQELEKIISNKKNPSDAQNNKGGTEGDTKKSDDENKSDDKSPTQTPQNTQKIGDSDDVKIESPRTAPKKKKKKICRKVKKVIVIKKEDDSIRKKNESSDSDEHKAKPSNKKILVAMNADKDDDDDSSSDDDKDKKASEAPKKAMAQKNPAPAKPPVRRVVTKKKPRGET